MKEPIVHTIISGVIGLVIGMVMIYAVSRLVASATYIPLGEAMNQIKNQLASPSLDALDVYNLLGDEDTRARALKKVRSFYVDLLRQQHRDCGADPVVVATPDLAFTIKTDGTGKVATSSRLMPNVGAEIARGNQITFHVKQTSFSNMGETNYLDSLIGLVRFMEANQHVLQQSGNEIIKGLVRAMVADEHKWYKGRETINKTLRAIIEDKEGYCKRELSAYQSK